MLLSAARGFLVNYLAFLLLLVRGLLRPVAALFPTPAKRDNGDEVLRDKRV